MRSVEGQDQRDPDQPGQRQQHQQPLHEGDQPPPSGDLVPRRQSPGHGLAQGRLGVVGARPGRRPHGPRPGLRQGAADLIGEHRDRVVDVGSLRPDGIGGVAGQQLARRGRPGAAQPRGQPPGRPADVARGPALTGAVQRLRRGRHPGGLGERRGQGGGRTRRDVHHRVQGGRSAAPAVARGVFPRRTRRGGRLGGRGGRLPGLPVAGRRPFGRSAGLPGSCRSRSRRARAGGTPAPGPRDRPCHQPSRPAPRAAVPASG